jgi:hypothetical protein
MNKPCVFGKRCEKHDFIHGAEAEELREELEKFAETDETGEANWARSILEKVDARDSAAYVEVRNKQR